MTAISNIQLVAQQFASHAKSIAASVSQAETAVSGSTDLSAAYQAPFAGLFQEAIQKTQQLETDAANTVTGLLSGQGVDIHTAMIATEKSDLGFEMMLAFRNKAVAAYQQLMQLQF